LDVCLSLCLIQRVLLVFGVSFSLLAGLGFRFRVFRVVGFARKCSILLVQGFSIRSLKFWGVLNHGAACQDLGVDRATKLRTIPFALAICREWRDLVTPHTEYAALRLAKFDLTWENRPHQTTADDFVVDRFDRNVVLLSKSWELSSPMSHRLRTAPLSDLADVELDALRGELQAGWGAEALISKGADWQSMERVWVTPSMRE
jgi:hypothetical protein